MLKKHTVENTIFQGICATVTVNGKVVEFCDKAYQIGPFVVARYLLRDASGEFITALNGGSVIRLWCFGIGSVELSDARGHFKKDQH
jgi:hypothetical protein